MMDRLPDQQLIFAIFHKVPIKSIGQSMCVSKQWLSLLKSPSFISSYTTANINNPSNQLLVSQESSKKISFNFDKQGFDCYKVLEPPFEPKYWDTCLRGVFNGVLPMVNRQGNIVLWNPTIRKTLTLPNFNGNSNNRCLVYPAVGFDTLTNDYKVVAYVRKSQRPSKHDCLRVFSLNRNSWGNDHIIIPTKRTCISKDSLSFKKFIHWMAYSESFIVRIDVTSEVVQVMKLPQCVEIGCNFSKMFVYNDNTIGVCHFTNDHHMAVWVMMEYGNADSWTKLWAFAYMPASLNWTSFYFRKSGELFLQVFLYNKVIERNQRFTILLDPETREGKSVMWDSGDSYIGLFGYFDESLVLLDHPNAESY